MDNILKIFFLVEFHLSCKKWLLIYKYQIKNSKIPSESEEIINSCSAWEKWGFCFVLFCLFVCLFVCFSFYSCCCLKHGHSEPKCHNLHNVQLIFVSVQRTAQTSFRIFLQPINNCVCCQITQLWQRQSFWEVDF